MAIEAFREEGVDVAIFETHHGGQFDSTNVIKCPAVTTITSIGLDHVRQLGTGPYSKQVENIAWHIAGILKPTAAALTTARNRETLTVLHERAAEIGVQLRVVETGFDLPANLVFLTEADKDNLSLACATANTFLAREGRDHLLSEDIERAFDAQKLLGRFSKCNDGDNIWYFDGAHNQMSMRVVAERFKSVAPTNHQKILVFGQESQERDSKDVLKELAYELRKLDIHFDHVIFTGTQQDSSNLKCQLPSSIGISTNTRSSLSFF
jgi:folylpolyglutamate synthase